MRGGTVSAWNVAITGAGLSPLARGNRLLVNSALSLPGPIPACAGEPFTPIAYIGHNGAYPRLRGGTLVAALLLMCALGLSPLARGNLELAPAGVARVGPIPACAGEPVFWVAISHPSRAYPRLRGGTVFAGSGASLPRGLSPLARGNPWLVLFVPVGLGPIPACAGEPKANGHRRNPKGAYPRLRGGTSHVIASQICNTGLSPLARGNQLHAC